MPTKTDFRNVNEYVNEYTAAQPPGVRAVLKRVRSIIRRAVPQADEMISYKIPTHKLHGRPVLYFAAWTEHFSLYPSTARLAAAFKDELAPHLVSKGTLRFALDEPVPVKLIEQVAKFRAKEEAEHARAKAPAAKTRR